MEGIAPLTLARAGPPTAVPIAVDATVLAQGMDHAAAAVVDVDDDEIHRATERVQRRLSDSRTSSPRGHQRQQLLGRHQRTKTLFVTRDLLTIETKNWTKSGRGTL